MSERDRFQFEHLLHAVIQEATHYGPDVTKQAHRILDDMRTELRKYGTVGYVTQSVTSVDPDSDDPKNVGTKPEVFTDGYFRLAEDPLKDGF